MEATRLRNGTSSPAASAPAVSTQQRGQKTKRFRTESRGARLVGVSVAEDVNMFVTFSDLEYKSVESGLLLHVMQVQRQSHLHCTELVQCASWPRPAHGDATRLLAKRIVVSCLRYRKTSWSETHASIVRSRRFGARRSAHHCATL